jgi:cell division protein FtsA
LSGGLVLTGGGAALAGVVELAGNIFKMPVRIGVPVRFANLGGLIDNYQSPSYATAIGLVLEGDRREMEEKNERDPLLWPKPQTGRSDSGVFGRIGKWIKDGLF